MEINLSDTPLPKLRDDLELLEGGRNFGGEPYWLIYDPLRNSYFKISETIFLLLSKWQTGTVKKLSVAGSELLGRNISEDEISDILKFLFTNQLTQQPAQDGYKFYAQQKASSQKSFAHQALHNYLFFRVPLARPQKFLDLTYPFVSWFFKSHTAFIFAVLAFLALYLVGRQWDIFINQFIAFLSWQGIFYYGCSLVVVKIAHELGHAFMAKKFGLQVSTIGVAFLVLYPVLYTDTSQAWQLARKKRLLIDCGGIFVELAIAIVASLAWVFCPDGAVRAAFFSLATLSWVMSLLVNLNPFMRFDGYYIFSDMLGFENMQTRGFAIGRWKMREVLFGVGEPVPEKMPTWQQNYSIIYSWCTWVYRFFLFIGIAILVYKFFIKFVAIILFIAELLFFIFIPIFRELKEWWQMKDKIIKSNRGRATLAIFAAIVVLCFLPLSSRVEVAAILQAKNELTIYASTSGKLEKLNIKNGQQVNKGDVLAEVSSKNLMLAFERTNKKIKLLQQRVGRAGIDAIEKQQRQALISELEQTKKTAASQQQQIEMLKIKASIDGVIKDLPPEVHAGRYISNEKKLFTIIGGGTIINGLIGENNISRVGEGATGTFYPDDIMLPKIKVRLESVGKTSIAVLKNEEHAQKNGGRVPTKQTQTGQLKPHGSYYRAKFETDESTSINLGGGRQASAITQRQRGIILLKAERRSLAGQLARRVFAVLIRESGF